jgi:hypothetical protein
MLYKETIHLGYMNYDNYLLINNKKVMKKIIGCNKIFLSYLQS